MDKRYFVAAVASRQIQIEDLEKKLSFVRARYIQAHGQYKEADNVYIPDTDDTGLVTKVTAHDDGNITYRVAIAESLDVREYTADQIQLKN